MCGVLGLITPKLTEFDLLSVLMAVDTLRERGTDGVGVGIYDDGQYSSVKHTDDDWRLPLATELRRHLGHSIILIANVRAEPTTEREDRENPETYCHPFFGNNVAVVHNGTIANDYQLEANYGRVPGTIIDSAVLPGLFEREGMGTTALSHIVGSYAILATDGEVLLTATNYKPLYRNTYDDGQWFASTPESLQVLRREPWAEPQYTATLWSINKGKAYETPLYFESNYEAQKALVVFSGGLDSTVAATHAARTFGADNTTLLHFKYGCRAERQEERALTNVSAALGVETMTLDVTDLFKVIAGTSPLLREGAEIQHDADKGAEYAYEWVPARNLVFLALATALAENTGYTHLVLGNNLEESGAYPDNEPEFIRRFNHLLPYAVSDGQPVKEVLQPVGNLMKHQIVKLGLELEAPLDMTWSCYDGDSMHCGLCGPCKMRRVAFQMNDAEDPIVYAAPLVAGGQRGQ